MSVVHENANARRIERTRLLSRGFRLWRHLCMFGVLAVAGITVGYWLARESRIVDLWIVPFFLLSQNVAEYLIHRLLMHRPSFLRALYQGHMGHHRAFQYDAMEIAAWSEMGLVMMPWFSIALLFVGMAPIVWVTARTVGPGPAGLLLVTSTFSFVFYEMLHALYHFPSPVLGRLGLAHSRTFAFLSRHHRHHHRLERMRWVNFNISVPLSDLMFGTRETEAAWQAARERRVSGSPGMSERGASSPHDAGPDKDDEAPPLRVRK